MKPSLAVFLSLTVGVLATPVFAQRADDNAIADAEDAFGSSDGGDDLGLYGPSDVRGFSPIDAGNVRLEGLFIDRQADLSPRLVEGSRVRVGLTAAGYGLPAPSGIVDYRLRDPSGDRGLSMVVQANSFGGHVAELDVRSPLSATVHFGGGVSASRSEYASGNNADVFNAAAIVAWTPSSQLDLRGFWSGVRIRDEDIFPIVQGDGLATPPRLVRRRFLGQDWADVETRRMNAGLLLRSRIGPYAVRAGVFRSVTDIAEGHSVFLATAPSGSMAPRSVSAYPGREAASTSGELGLARSFRAVGLEHRIAAIFRGRLQQRRFGGASRLPLPSAPFGEPLPAERPDFVFGPQTRDEVRQWSGGLTWSGSRTGWGEASVGVQKVAYSKSVRSPLGPRPETRDDPWLMNGSVVVHFSPWASGYASYATGLEESEVAPETAVNRDEAPPAVRTRQTDAGVRLKWDGLTLVAGGFEIERPYFGVDGSGQFRGLGDVRHRGVELSITGAPFEGLTVVAGGVFLEAGVSGEEVEAGLVGQEPVGTPSRKLTASLDWRPPGSPLSFDITVEQLGPAWADTANRVRVGGHEVLDLGARYRFNLRGRRAVLRIQATNLTNSYSWDVVGENSFVYTQPRQVLGRLTVDF